MGFRRWAAAGLRTRAAPPGEERGERRKEPEGEVRMVAEAEEKAVEETAVVERRDGGPELVEVAKVAAERHSGGPESAAAAAAAGVRCTEEEAVGVLCTEVAVAVNWAEEGDNVRVVAAEESSSVQVAGESSEAVAAESSEVVGATGTEVAVEIQAEEGDRILEGVVSMPEEAESSAEVEETGRSK